MLIIVYNCTRGTQHSIEQLVLFISPLILQTIVIAQMMSAGEEG